MLRRLRKNARKHKVAQSAMEYLMTYGWTILIISVVLASLWSLGVFSAPGGGGSGSCGGMVGYVCASPMLMSNGLLSVSIGQASYGKGSLTVTGTACSNSTVQPSSFSAASFALYYDQSTSVSFSCNLPKSTTGAQFSGTLWIQYIQGGNTGLVAQVGKVQTPVVTQASTSIFVATYVFSASATGTGGAVSCSPACSGSYPAGTQITVTATPFTNNVFGSWTGTCASSSDPCTFTMPANPDTESASFSASTWVPCTDPITSNALYASPISAMITITSMYGGGGGGGNSIGTAGSNVPGSFSVSVGSIVNVIVGGGGGGGGYGDGSGGGGGGGGSGYYGGGGGGGSGGQGVSAGGGGGSSAVLVNGALIQYASGGAGANSYKGYLGGGGGTNSGGSAGTSATVGSLSNGGTGQSGGGGGGGSGGSGNTYGNGAVNGGNGGSSGAAGADGGSSGGYSANGGGGGGGYGGGGGGGSGVSASPGYGGSGGSNGAGGSMAVGGGGSGWGGSGGYGGSAVLTWTGPAGCIP